MTRPLRELIDDAEPAWPLVLEWFKDATNEVVVLPAARAQGEAALLALQVTTRSPLGAIALEAGGVLVDHGWLRLLGAGCERLRESLVTWNGLDGRAPPLDGALLIAHDAAGGFFALNGGGLPAAPRSVAYAAPDTLEWLDMELGYSDFVRWAVTGDLATFYADLRWPGWEPEVAALEGDQGLVVWPPLFTKEGRAARLERRSRGVVPSRELWGLWHDFRRQLGIS